MTRKIECSPQVWRDLEEIADSIAKDNLNAALRFYDAAETAFDRLADMSGLGVARTFLNSRLGTVRMWPIPGFEHWLIFYRPIERGIEVLRVIHGARDIRALFEENQ